MITGDFSTSLNGIIVVMCLLLSGLLEQSSLDAWRHEREADHVVAVTHGARDAYAALQTLRSERGAVRLGLSTLQPASATRLADIAALRQ